MQPISSSSLDRLVSDVCLVMIEFLSIQDGGLSSLSLASHGWNAEVQRSPGYERRLRERYPFAYRDATLENKHLGEGEVDWRGALVAQSKGRKTRRIVSEQSTGTDTQIPSGGVSQWKRVAASVTDAILYACRQKRSKSSADHNVVMVGHQRCGKTEALYKLFERENKETRRPVYVPTVGFNFETVKLPTGYLVAIWDLGGDENIWPYWHCYYDHSRPLVFMIDANDSASFEEVAATFHEALKVEELRHVPVLVLANKQDLDGAFTADQIANVLDMGAVRQRWCIQACAASTGEGLTEGFSWLVSTMNW